MLKARSPHAQLEATSRQVCAPRSWPCPSLHPKHQESSAQTLLVEFWELFLALFLHGLRVTNTKLEEQRMQKQNPEKQN